MNKKALSEKAVCNAVIRHFRQNRFSDFTVDTECPIQFGAGRGRKNGIADVVLKDADGHWIAIIECKSEKVGDSSHGRGQLRSYLSATDTRFGILAFNDNPDTWIYCSNERSNVFIEKGKPYFDDHVNDSPRANRSDQTVTNQLKTNISTLKRNLKNITIGLIVAFIIIAVGIPIYFLNFHTRQNNTTYQVVRIIDGDTIVIEYEGEPTSVHFVGIDAPETMRSKQRQDFYGEEATEYLQDFLLDESIYFRFDENKRDEFDRILGYVYRSSDGIFVNLEMIREGYARVDKNNQFKYKELFQDYESRAKKERIGLWSRYQ